MPKEIDNTLLGFIDDTGYCIRCHAELKLNPMSPYCKKCYYEWKKFKNDEYVERYCHICGQKYAATLIKPACYQCWEETRDFLEYPLI